jgi:hypothetical protein
VSGEAPHEGYVPHAGRSRTQEVVPLLKSVGVLVMRERHTPAAQILIERRSVSEHGVHVRDAADVPKTDVLIEHRGAHEEDPAIRPRSSSHPLRVNRAC